MTIRRRLFSRYFWLYASAFSAIMVFATDLMPKNTGVIAGIFYGLSFGIAGIGSSFFGWLADRTSIQFIFEVSTLLPLLGVIAVFLPKMRKEKVPQLSSQHLHQNTYR